MADEVFKKVPAVLVGHGGVLLIVEEDVDDARGHRIARVGQEAVDGSLEDALRHRTLGYAEPCLKK